MHSTPRLFYIQKKFGSVCKNEGERSLSIALVLLLKTRHFHGYKNKTMTRHRPWIAWVKCTLGVVYVLGNCAALLRACHSGALERSDRVIESGEAIFGRHIAGVLYSFENVTLLGEE